MLRYAKHLLDVIDFVADLFRFGAFWLAQFMLLMLTVLVFTEFGVAGSTTGDLAFAFELWGWLVVIGFFADIVRKLRKWGEFDKIFAGTGDTEPLEPRRLKGSDR